MSGQTNMFGQSTNTEPTVDIFWARQIANSLVKKFNVKIRKGSKWQTDIDTKTITYTDDIQLLTHNEALGLLLHEIGHVLYTGKPTWDETKDDFTNSIIHECTNWLEDKRIEHLLGQEYVGGGEYLRLLGMRFEVQHPKTQRRIQTEHPQMINKLQADKRISYICDEDGRKDLSLSNNWYSEELLPINSEILMMTEMLLMGLPETPDHYMPEYQTTAREIADIVLGANVETMGSVNEVREFVETRVYPLIEPHLIKPKNFSRKNQGKLAEMKEGKGNVCGHAEHRPSGVGGYEWENMSESEKKTKTIRGMIDNMVEKRTGKSPGLLNPNRNHWNTPYTVHKSYVTHDIRKSVPAMRRILRDNMYDRLGGSYRTGFLNTSKLYKARLGKTKIFQKKVESKNKSYSFSLLIDTSGSMNGARIRDAIRSAVMLSEILGECGVDYSIRFFSNGSTNGKEYGKQLSPSTFDQNLRSCSGGGTEIWSAIERENKDLRVQDTQNKIMIVLTDGQIWGRDAEHIQSLVTKDKGTHYYGVGIRADIAQVFGNKRSIRIDKTSDLMPYILQILKKHLTKN